MNENPKLTFKAGKFIFENPNPVTRVKMAQNPYWRRHSTWAYENKSSWAYETVNIKQAWSYRSYRDEKANKVFNRAFQQFYKLPELPPLPLLDPLQREGLKWILSRSRSYLAHAPGAGKTPQAILAACLAEGPGQNLFIVPPGLVTNWAREILKFTEWLGIWPAIGIVPLSGAKETMAWKAEFIICPDSMLTKNWVYERLVSMQKKVLAVDEASRFKESTAERSIAFYGGRNKNRFYPGLFQSARHTVFLDGSPMPNRPMELWAPTYALHPQAIDCMSQDDFGYRYCGPRLTERGQYTFDHSCREDELKQRLQKDFMHVVLESDLTHPERRRSMHFINQDARSPEHKSWERRHLSTISLDDIDEGMNQGDIAKYRRELGIRKVPHVVSYIKERINKNESILIFAWHREVCGLLAFALRESNAGMITDAGTIFGGVPIRERIKICDEFQAGKRKIVILNIAAGGRGLNLQRADRVIFAEFSWSDELNRQAEKRASRRGNDKAVVRCEYVVSPGSMDEVILNSVFTKAKRVERIIG